VIPLRRCYCARQRHGGEDGRRRSCGKVLGRPIELLIADTASAYYWDRSEVSRAFSKRYSSTRHFLEAVRAVGTVETAAVMQQMKDTPINNFYATNGHIREDGCTIRGLLFSPSTCIRQSRSRPSHGGQDLPQGAVRRKFR
jgi:hypothetical protein